MTPAHHEKRREQRRPADGAARVLLASPQREILGRLIDVSNSGFRMAHDCQVLTAGQLVEFSHDSGAGQARVMWTKIVSGNVESGFLVMSAGA